MSLAAEIEALERSGWEALAGPDGAAFYEEIMADEGLMVFPGLVLDKPETIRTIAAAGPWSSFELSDIRVVESTPDSAFITYRAAAVRPSEDPYLAMMTTVYARRDGRWRLGLHQQSPDR